MKFLATIFVLTGCLLIGLSLHHNSSTDEAVNLRVTNSSIKKNGQRNSFPGQLQSAALNESNRLVSLGNDMVPSKKLTNRFNELENCLRDVEKHCDEFSADSERDYATQVLTEEHRILNDYIKDLKNHPLMRDAEGESLSRQILLGSYNPDLQLSALELISLYPTSTENLGAIATPLQSTVEDQLLERGLEVLENYKNISDFQEKITTLFDRQVRVGISEETSQKAAHALFRFMNDESYKYFSYLRDAMKRNMDSKNSEVALRGRYLALDSALREYEGLRH